MILRAQQYFLKGKFSGLFNLRSLILVLLIFSFDSCSDKTKEQVTPDPTPVKTETDWSKIADQVQIMTINAYWSPTAHYYNQNNQGNAAFNYWWNAHALDVLVDAYARTEDAKYKTLMSELHDGIKARNNNSFINDFYDDMEWLAIAGLRAFELTQDVKYKSTVDLLWLDIKTGWNNNLGGGIAWRKSQLNYKNTPANAPAVIFAARLYQLTNNPDDLEWAKKIYAWQKANLVDPVTGQVWDGKNRTGNNATDKDWKFTYCQGVYIGAALELYKITKEEGYLSDAIKTANFSIKDSQLAPNGLLKSEGTGDGGLFKGVLVRYLTLLALEPTVPEATRTEYIKFLKFNAETLWSIGTQKSTYLFGAAWNTPPTGATDSSIQLSGLMLVEAMAKLQKAGVLK